MRGGVEVHFGEPDARLQEQTQPRAPEERILDENLVLEALEDITHPMLHLGIHFNFIVTCWSTP